MNQQKNICVFDKYKAKLNEIVFVVLRFLFFRKLKIKVFSYFKFRTVELKIISTVKNLI